MAKFQINVRRTTREEEPEKNTGGDVAAECALLFFTVMGIVGVVCFILKLVCT